MIYTFAGLVYAAVATLLVFPATVVYPARVYSVLIFLLVFSTPLPLALVLVGSRSQARMLLAVGVWVSVVACIGSLWGVRYSALALEMWLFWAGIPTAILVLLTARRLRTAGPIVFAAGWLLFAAISGGAYYAWDRAVDEIGIHPARPELSGQRWTTVATQIRNELGELGQLPARQRVAAIGSMLSRWRGLYVVDHPERATAGFMALFCIRWLVPVALAAGVIWGLLVWYARRYRERRSSDLMLALDTLWLTYTLGYILLAGTTNPKSWAPGSFILAFVAYKIACAAGHRAATTGKGAPAMKLLVLRVFGHEQRTQELLDALQGSWRHLGPIRLISGPDSAYATLEPHEFYEFLGGRLVQQFVCAPQDLERRLGTASVADPDGLYRTECFYCHRDTWQMTVSQLLCRSDTILMDLRSFGEANQGCVFELRELVWAAPLARTVFVVDKTTDLQLLEAVLLAAWKRRPADSPNAGEDVPTVRLFRANSRARQMVRTLLPTLLEPATVASRSASGPI